MANLIDVILVQGKHQALDSGGKRYSVAIGERIKITEDQLELFKDRFKRVSDVEAEAKAVIAQAEVETEVEVEVKAAVKPTAPAKA